MEAASTCHEIVHFSFRTGIPPAEQLAFLRQLGDWARTQPGFRSRRCYRDDERNCWTDVVEWESVDSARAAAAQIMAEPQLAPAMSAIENSGMSFGHYREAIRMAVD
jgi:hypothetical protein